MTTPVRKARKKQRANESPLTFIRSQNSTNLGLGKIHDNDEDEGAKLRRHQWLERILFFCEESMACLNAESGTHLRDSIYTLLPMLDHEQFDTMGIRRVRNFFAYIPTPTNLEELKVTMLPPSALPDLTSGEEDEGNEFPPILRDGVPMTAVPKMDSKAYSERSYILRLSLADEPEVAIISIEHAIEELLERCPFLRDPSTTWVSRPSKLHVLLATTSSSNVTKEIRQCKNVAHASSPIKLKLKRLIWRRQGTLWVQWHCSQGNVDRLRADLRIASGGTVSQTFTPLPEENPSLGRPFALETLVMATLQKPTKEEFAQLVRVTSDMQRMFEGVTVKFSKIARVCQIHNQLDRDALNGEQTLIDLATNPHKHAESFVDQLSRAYFLTTHSPSVGRIVLSAALSTAVIGAVATTFIYRKFR